MATGNNESQFVRWNSFLVTSAFREEPARGRHEPYWYEVPEDDRSFNLSAAFLALWKWTRDPLAVMMLNSKFEYN